MYVKKIIWNAATCDCQNEKYLANIMDDSAVICDEAMDVKAKSNEEETKTVLTSFSKKI